MHKWMRDAGYWIIAGVLGGILLIIFSGCCARDVTEIKPRVITPPVIEETVEANLRDSSYNFYGAEIAERTEAGVIYDDTVAHIEFRPHPLLDPCIDEIRELQKKNKALGLELNSIGEFYLKIKPDPIILWDTVRINQKVETPLLSKAGLVLIGIIVGLIGMFFLRR